MKIDYFFEELKTQIELRKKKLKNDYQVIVQEEEHKI